MSTPVAATVCRNCGAPDLGTNFCESCGAQMVRGIPATSAANSPHAVTGLPLGLFLGGIIAAAVLSLIQTLTSFRLAVGFDVATLIADAVAVFGVWQAGVAGGTRQAFRVLGLVIALLSPVLDVVVLLSDATNSYAFYFGVARGAFLLLPALTVLAWLVATGLPGRAYFTLFIAGAAGLLANTFGYAASGLVGILLSAAGIVGAVLVANSVGGGPARSAAAAPASAGPYLGNYSGSDAAYTAIARPQTTNGFAVSALIFGLIGGTILPIVFGHVALAQIGRTGERGRGMAIAGLILGYLSLTIVIIIVIVVAVAAANRPAYY